MISDYEKTLRYDSSSGDRIPPSTAWAKYALAASITAFLLSSLILFYFSPWFPDRLVILLWLGIVPVHVVALSSALWVLARHVPAGFRLAALDLRHRGFVSLWNNVGKKILLVVLVYLGSMFITAMTTTILFRVFDYQPPPMPLFEMLISDPTPGLFISILVMAVFIAPVSEEILFRVVLFETVRPFGWGFAAVLTAIVFALVHGSILHLPALFFLGLILQHIRSRSSSLWPCIFCHMLFNAFTFPIIGLWLLLA